jgi:hypothetical protein
MLLAKAIVSTTMIKEETARVFILCEKEYLAAA